MAEQSGDREGIIRLATEYMGIAKAGMHTEARRVYIPVEGWWKEFNPFESPTDAYDLESAIPEAKRDAYCRELWAIVVIESRGGWKSQYAGYWYMVHASPRQRSQAALEIIKESA